MTAATAEHRPAVWVSRERFPFRWPGTRVARVGALAVLYLTLGMVILIAELGLEAFVAWRHSGGAS